jgi:ribosomal protein S18 acetylase RimI-like enzyme
MQKNKKSAKNSRKESSPPNEPKRSFTVRQMEIDDLAEVYKLGDASFKPDLWPMLYRSWDEYEVTTLFNTDGDYCLVAENDDDGPADERIVGFVLGTVISKPASAWSYGYIIWLCAHPSWQREGVASELVDSLIETMIEEDGIRIMMADTDPQNQRAVKFFHKKGFTNDKPHVYLSTNLELNKNYKDLIIASREAALDAEYLKKIRKLAEDRTSNRNKKKKNNTKKAPSRRTTSSQKTKRSPSK